MAVTVNGSVLTAQVTTQASPATLSWASVVLTAGDIIVVVSDQNGAAAFPSPSAPTGGTGLSWTQIVDQQNTAAHFSRVTAWWTKVPSNQTSTISQQCTTSTGFLSLLGALYRLSGADQVTPVGQTDGFQGQTDPTSTDLQLLNTLGGSLIVMAAADWSAGTASLTISTTGTANPATDLNTLESAEFRGISYHADQSSGTVQGTLDYSAATGDWAAVIFEIEAAAAGDAALSQQWPEGLFGPWPLPQWIPTDEPLVSADVRPQIGTCSFAADGSAANAKVAKPTGVGTAGTLGTAIGLKVGVETGTGTAGATGTATGKKVAQEQGIGAAGVTGSGTDTTAIVKAEQGTGTAGATGSTVDKKVAIQKGTVTLGAAGTGTDAKIANEQGTGVAAVNGRATDTAGVARAQTGLCGLAAIGAATARKVASGHTAACTTAFAPRGALTKRAVSTGLCGLAAAPYGAARKLVGQRGTSAAALSPYTTTILLVFGGTLDLADRSIADLGTDGRKVTKIGQGVRAGDELGSDDRNVSTLTGKNRMISILGGG